MTTVGSVARLQRLVDEEDMTWLQKIGNHFNDLGFTGRTNCGISTHRTTSIVCSRSLSLIKSPVYFTKAKSTGGILSFVTPVWLL